MAFEYFIVLIRITFMANCLRTGIKQSSSRKLVQALTGYGCSLRFPRNDFIVSFRIVFPMKCRLIEDIGMNFWLETKMQGKQLLGTLLQSYLVLVTKLYFGVTVVHFSLSHFSGGLWIWPLPYSPSNAFIKIFKLLKLVWKFKAVFLLQIHFWVEVPLNASLKIRKSSRFVR